MNGHISSGGTAETEGSPQGRKLPMPGGTGRTRREAVGIAFGLVAFVLLSGGGMRVLGRVVQSGTPAAKSVEGAETYRQYDRASDLLLHGGAREAGQIMDRMRPESLIVEGGATGRGALTDRSSMTLLMDLIKRTGKQAERAAQAGDFTEARAWLLRGWRLGDQVIGTPRPGSEALTVAHFADCYLSQVQSRVAHLCGDARGEKIARLRGARLMQVWHEKMEPELHRAHIGIAATDADTAALRVLCDRYSRYRMQAGAGAWANQV